MSCIQITAFLFTLVLIANSISEKDLKAINWSWWSNSCCFGEDCLWYDTKGLCQRSVYADLQKVFQWCSSYFSWHFFYLVWNLIVWHDLTVRRFHSLFYFSSFFPLLDLVFVEMCVTCFLHKLHFSADCPACMSFLMGLCLPETSALEY